MANYEQNKLQLLQTLRRYRSPISTKKSNMPFNLLLFDEGMENEENRIKPFFLYPFVAQHFSEGPEEEKKALSGER